MLVSVSVGGGVIVVLIDNERLVEGDALPLLDRDASLIVIVVVGDGVPPVADAVPAVGDRVPELLNERVSEVLAESDGRERDKLAVDERLEVVDGVGEALVLPVEVEDNVAEGVSDTVEVGDGVDVVDLVADDVSVGVAIPAR